MSKLLIVDDEQSISWGLRKLGENAGHQVATAASAEQALAAIDRERPDAIILDIRLPGMDGLTAIPRIHEKVGRVPIIVITAYGDLETAVDAVRHGAFEYIVKPFDLDKVQRALDRALNSSDLAVIGRPRVRDVGGLVGHAASMQEVFKQIALAAASDTSILLCGESGTGKELAARAIHQYSDRSAGPFVAVNVASLSESLAESELFGHKRGAFTGADQDRVGLLVQANGGTLFLDEVADIPLPAQVKLLRVLEHGEVAPVGSGSQVRTDFRVVSATHQNLLAKVKDGTFRHDLYFRLAAFRIELPPLRERRDDIRDLAEHFLYTTVKSQDAAPPTVSDAAIVELEQRAWYGNVRELRNAMEHAVIVARGGVIEPDHLPEPASAAMFAPHAASISLNESIADLVARWSIESLAEAPETDELYDRLLRLVEPPLLKAALDKHHGQCAAAARQLGMHRTTLRKKLDQYEIDED